MSHAVVKFSGIIANNANNTDELHLHFHERKALEPGYGLEIPIFVFRHLTLHEITLLQQLGMEIIGRSKCRLQDWQSVSKARS
jgi:hypothetical protein